MKMKLVRQQPQSQARVNDFPVNSVFQRIGGTSLYVIVEDSRGKRWMTIDQHEGEAFLKVYSAGCMILNNVEFVGMLEITL